MIRDAAASRDGWFWGWYGWPDVDSGWKVDYPPAPSSPLPFMGFGQYCVNCHASAHDNHTFASLNNIKGEGGTFLSFLAQDFWQTQSFGGQAPLQGPRAGITVASEHLKVLEEERTPASTMLLSLPPSNQDFMASLHLGHLPAISHEDAVKNLKMPSQTYDNVWISGKGPVAGHTFVTSDQCIRLSQRGRHRIAVRNDRTGFLGRSQPANPPTATIFPPTAPGAPARWVSPAATRSCLHPTRQ